MTVNDTTTKAKRTKKTSARRPPVYARIQEHFLKRIADKKLHVGDRLPTEMEIAKQFGTSRATVQTAMSRLVTEGWIEKRVGSGTYVADPGRSATIDLKGVRSFEEDVVNQGDRVTYRLLKVQREPASEEVAERLGIAPGLTVMALERLRFVGNSIIGMERRTFARGISLDFPVDALDTTSTHELIERYLGLRIGRMDASIRAVAANGAVANHLEVANGSPLLLRRHTMFSQDGNVILFGEAFYREPFAFRYVAGSSDTEW